MGGGCYSYARDVKTKLANSAMSRGEVFSQRSMSPELDIKGKIRECRDSDEHPETLPIIIALDVTGSMGTIPHRLVTQDFPSIMKKIMDEGIQHPQVCFVGIGDHECDHAPLQVGQFEASDELLDSWLRKIYLEGGGGGNAGESYLLAWKFAAFHTDIDSYAKRGRKGILITIGDEPTLKSLTPTEVNKVFNEGVQTPMLASELLERAREKWEVYHINVMDYSGSRQSTIDGWKEYLKENCILTESRDGSDIPNIIAGIIVSESKKTPSQKKAVLNDSSSTAETESPVTDDTPHLL